MSAVFKSIANDFAGVEPNIGKLQEEINTATNIDPTCLYISMYGDTVEINFDGALSSAGEIALAAVIAAHDPTPIITYSTNVAASLTAQKTKNPTYTRVGTVIFPGASAMRVKAVGYADVGSTISIRVANALTAEVYSEATFANNVPEILDLGTPTTPSDLTSMVVMVKRNGGAATNFARIDALYIYYN